MPYQQPSMPGQYAASHAAYQAFPSYPAQSYAYQPYQQKPPNAHTNQVAACPCYTSQHVIQPKC